MTTTVLCAPLSRAQERMWFVDAANGGNPTYNVPLFLRWTDQIDVAALTVALNVVISRHQALRTTYQLQATRVVQVVADPQPIAVTMMDLTGVPNAVDLARQQAQRLGREPFDLAAGPVLRCVVWCGLADGDAMLLTIHHIAVDGWSLAPLLEDLAVAYEAALIGKTPQFSPLPVSYAQFAARERRSNADPTLCRQLADRAAQLLAVPADLTLAGCRQQPPAPEGSRPGRQQVFVVPDDLRAGVGQLARKLRATPFVVLFAAVQVVLQRWSGRSKFLVGAITANRLDPKLEQLVGVFVNTVPLRCHLDGAASFVELCAATRVEAFNSLTYQRIAFNELTAAVTAARGQGQSALVNVGFAYQNMPTARNGIRQRWAPPRVLSTDTAKFDLLLICEDDADGLTITVEYDTDRYPDATGRGVGEDMVAVLDAVIADPTEPIHQLLPHGPDTDTLPASPPSARIAKQSELTLHEPATDASAKPSTNKSATAILTADEQRAADLFATALAKGSWHKGATDRWLPATNFFAVGGQSLLAVTMLAEAKRRYGVVVSPRDFLADPTIAALGRLLAVCALAEPNQCVANLSSVAVAGERYPATEVQQRLWFLDRIALRTAYLVPTVVELIGRLDREALRRAVDLVFARHPALRSRFELDRKQRKVFYRTDGPAPALTKTSWPKRQELREHLAAYCWAGFDLVSQAPARAEIISVDDRTLLVLVAHHIVVDGWSRQLLLTQIAQAYHAEVSNNPVDLPDPVHPATLATVDMSPIEGIAAVVAKLRGAPTDVWLPRNRTRGQTQATLGATCNAILDPQLTARLRAVATEELGCSTFMTIAALLAVALARCCNQRDFLFAFPWAGRDVPASVNAVGMYVNTLVLRVDLRGEPTWRQALNRVKESSLFCYRYADVPFDSLAAALHPDRDLSRPPLTPVYLALAEDGAVVPSFGVDIQALYLPLDPLHVKYELELVATENDGQLELAASYAVELFADHTVIELLNWIITAAVDLTSDPNSRPL